MSGVLLFQVASPEISSQQCAFSTCSASRKEYDFKTPPWPILSHLPRSDAFHGLEMFYFLDETLFLRQQLTQLLRCNTLQTSSQLYELYVFISSRKCYPHDSGPVRTGSVLPVDLW